MIDVAQECHVETGVTVVKLGYTAKPLLCCTDFLHRLQHMCKSADCRADMHTLVPKTVWQHLMRMHA